MHLSTTPPSITLLLHNIRSCHNVGSILRTADGFGVRTAIFSGYTPRYDDPALLPHLRAKLNHQIEKTALGAEHYLTLQTSSDISATLATLHAQGYLILGLENNLSDPRKLTLSPADFTQFRCALRSAQKQGSHLSSAAKTSPVRASVAKAYPAKISLSSASPAETPTPDPLRLALLLGEEVAGINPSLYDHIDYFLEIPMHGQKESFNVSVATAIALFCLSNV